MKAIVFESQKYALDDRLNNLRQSYIDLLTHVSQNETYHFDPVVMDETFDEPLMVDTINNGYLYSSDDKDTLFRIENIFNINDLNYIVNTLDLN